MGSKLEFNWILKLSPQQGFPSSDNVVAEGVFEFEKTGQRFYPIDMPIELVDQNWNVVAEVVVTELNISSSATRGKFRVLNVLGTPRKSLYAQYPD